MAKVYLYMENYDKVYEELTPIVSVIKEGKELSLVPTPETFPNNLKTSKDIILRFNI